MNRIKAFVFAGNIKSQTGKILMLLSYIWFFVFVYFATLKETLNASLLTGLIGVTVFVAIRAFALITESLINILYIAGGMDKELNSLSGETKNSLNEIERNLKETASFFKRVEDKLDLKQ